MDLQTVIHNVSTLGNGSIAPAKSILVILIQIVIQVLQYMIYLLNLALTKL